MSFARRAASQLLSSRSVHLRIQPRPANLSESREILRVLQGFGELSTYKYLRYEYHNPAANIALAIYSDEAGAQKALNASPIRFALEKLVDDTKLTGERQLSEGSVGDDSITPDSPANDGVDEITELGSLVNRMPKDPPRIPDLRDGSLPDSTVKSQPTLMPFEQPSQVRMVSTKWFQVTVDRSRVVHQDYVERQPYWKQFSPMQSMAQQDLSKSVPHIGLSDVSKRPIHAHRTPNRVLASMANDVEYKMPSLKRMYEESLPTRVRY
ncbi:hypothetical protein B0J11DRAFT_184105 [Dendryphion nanum]|uniref:Uncharacterized protein n=1 Tax=Dendryphion nanum TaxID=256645 RepID=A0A9P9D4A5_9PLEO|nr:hypothetical protein B0J11DRAFT_184105 [Dendryphion nanum]